MTLLKRIASLLFTTLFIILTATQTIQAGDYKQDEEQRRPSTEAMIVDGLIIRPLSLASTVVGTGIFVVTLPFSIFGGNVEQAADSLIVEPAQATFTNCLGCIGRNKKRR